ncbi:hypothetical protein BH11CYA1_BH11CYA1_19680 [soil metagenome]
MPRICNEATVANNLLISTCLSEFFSLVPTEEAALDLILQTQVQHKKLFCKCGYVFEDAIREQYERKVLCKECKKYTYFTVGTLYEGVSQIQARLGAVWMMDYGAVVTSTKLHQIFGIATSTGLKIINTIGAFIESLRGASCDLASEKVSCPYFSEIMIRRSRISGAYEHASAIPQPAVVVDSEPLADTNFPTSSGDNRDQNSTFDDLGDFEKEVLGQISAVPKSVDELSAQFDHAAGPVGAALTMLELFGHIDQAPGNCFVRSRNAKPESTDSILSPELLALITAAINNIKAIRQGVSRKYLQLYLGTFWCFFDREFWRMGSLVVVSIDRSLSPDRDLLAYESPLMVSLVHSLG